MGVKSFYQNGSASDIASGKNRLQGRRKSPIVPVTRVFYLELKGLVSKETAMQSS